MSKSEKAKVKNKDVRASTFYSQESGLAEMVYKPDELKTQFAIWKDNQIGYKHKIESSLGVVRPLKSDDDLVKLKFLKFASVVGDYGTEEELFLKIKEHIEKYVQLPSKFLTTTAVYIMMTWIYDQFHTIPYLRVIGSFGTGKTRFLGVVGSLCYKAMLGGGSTSVASVFRMIHEYQGSFVFDEADFKQSESWNEIIKILNSGHTRDFPVTRMEQVGTSGKFKVRVFYVFGPKILASRERFTDEALESRCLSQVLLPRTDIKVPIHLPSIHEQEALNLRNKLLAFRFKHYGLIADKQVEIGESLNLPRMKQTILALACTADLIDKKVLKTVIAFAKLYEEELIVRQSTTLEADVLICIGKFLNDKRYLKIQKDKIRVGDIAAEFNRRFGDEYNLRMDSLETSVFKAKERKIGEIIKKLGIKKGRDNKGVFIPATEKIKIKRIMERHGITKDMVDYCDENNDNDDEDIDHRTS